MQAIPISHPRYPWVAATMLVDPEPARQDSGGDDLHPQDVLRGTPPRFYLLSCLIMALVLAAWLSVIR